MSADGAQDDEQDRIDLRASEWVVLAGDRPLSAAEQAELDRWLAADPRHRAAWQELGRTWGTIPHLSGLADIVPADATIRQAGAGRDRRRFFKRRVVPAAAVAAAAAAAVLIVGPRQREETFRTGIAEQRMLTLDDGSRVTLGPRSGLTVRFSRTERRVTLGGGEAFFEVAHNAHRPFYVEAGTSLTRVVGTKFDVDYGAGSVRVAVLQGLVQVSDRALSADDRSARTLRGGERAEVRPTGIVVTGDAQRPSASSGLRQPGAWRGGRLVYDDARLLDLVADVNRYYAPGVVVAGKGIDDLRITASFKVTEIPAFLEAVGSVVPVKAVEKEGGAIELTRAR